MKKVVIAGGTGFIGTYLAHRFQETGYEVQIISRGSGYVSWHMPELTNAIEGAEVVINLAGKSINCRHNKSNREAILQSRIISTQMIGQAVMACKNPPELWINASATGIYNTVDNSPATEASTDFASTFIGGVVKCWEQTFFDLHLSKTRQAVLRTSVVLGRGGGALSPFLMLSRLGLGGRQASGKQMFSWIHIEDYFQIIRFLITDKYLSGVFNCTSPNPVPNFFFMGRLRKFLSVPFGLPGPQWIIRIVAKIIGTEPELLLSSSNVIPQRLISCGYRFTYPDLDRALEDLILKRRGCIH